MYFVSLSLHIYIAGYGFMHLFLPFFVCLMKTKNPDFIHEIRIFVDSDATRNRNLTISS